MADQTNPADWFIRDESQEWGPVSEVEMRQRLAKQPTANLRVRQGNSGWVDAATVLRKFRELAERGVYLRRQGSPVEGPFTAPRAFELLRDMDRTGVESRIGRSAPWIDAERLYLRLARLVEKTPTQAAGRSGRSGPSPPQVSRRADNIPMARLVDEIPVAMVVEEAEFVEAIPVEAVPVEAIPVEAVPVEAVPVDRGPPSVGERKNHDARRSDPVAVAPRDSVPQPSVIREAHAPLVLSGRRSVKKKASPGKGLWIIAGCGLAFLLLLASGGLYYVYRGGSDRGAVADAAAERTLPASGGVQRSHRLPPPVLPGSLFRPTFHTELGEVDAGTAFAARLDSTEETIVLSALHLLGPAGGLPADVPPQQVPSLWQGLSLLDCRSGHQHSHVPGTPLLLVGTKPFPEASAGGDVIAFRAGSSARFRSYQLASESPQAGDPVWLVSEVIDSAQLVHAAHVIGEMDGWLAYEFVAPRIELRATSGAPVLNADHQVVAVNAGGGSEGGRTVGLGTSVSKFRDSLSDVTSASRTMRQNR